jgi:autotransporter-associated beta strand protein
LNGNQTFGGTIGGVGTLIKLGAGTLTLSGANAYTGLTTVSGGILSVNNTNALGGTLSGTTVSGGASLELSGGITFVAESLTLAGTGVLGTGALRNSTGNNTWTGAITLAADTRIQSDSGTLTLDAASGNVISGSYNLSVGGVGSVIIADVLSLGAGSVIKEGAGTLTLSGSNNFTGGLMVNGGTVAVGNAGALNADAPNTVSFGSGVPSGTRLQLHNYDLTVAGLDTDVALPGSPVVENGGATSGTLTVSRALGLESTFAGVLQDGLGGGSLSVRKTGAGKLTLGGVNTYTGNTEIAAGTLAFVGNGGVSGALVTLGSGATLDVRGRSGGGWTLGSGQTLSGAGTVGGTLTVASGATLLPTVSAGFATLNTGNLILNGEIRLTLGGNSEGTVGDKLVVSGALTLGGGSAITLFDDGGARGLGSLGAGVYELLTASGGITGTFGTFTASATGVGQTLSYEANRVLLLVGALSGAWTGTANNGLWDTGANWAGGGAPGTNVASRGTDTASFGTGGVPGTVFLGATKTQLTSLSLDALAGSGYTLARSGATQKLWLYAASGSAQISVSGGTHAVALPVVLESDLEVSVANARDNLSVSGVIAGGTSGVQSLFKTGLGSVTLAETNTYAGGTSLAAGTLRVGNDSALGTGTLTVNAGRLSANDTLTSRTLANAVVLAGDVELGDSTYDAALTLNGRVTLTASRVLSVNSSVV